MEIAQSVVRIIELEVQERGKFGFSLRDCDFILVSNPWDLLRSLFFDGPPLLPSIHPCSFTPLPRSTPLTGTLLRTSCVSKRKDYRHVASIRIPASLPSSLPFSRYVHAFYPSRTESLLARFSLNHPLMHTPLVSTSIPNARRSCQPRTGEFSSPFRLTYDIYRLHARHLIPCIIAPISRDVGSRLVHCRFARRSNR